MKRRAFIATIAGAFAALKLPESRPVTNPKPAGFRYELDPQPARFVFHPAAISIDDMMAAESKRIGATISRHIAKRSPFLDLLK